MGTEALIEVLEELVSSSNLEGAKLGVSVVDVNTGATVFVKNDEQLLNPASCMKLLTTLAVLKELGPSHKFTTKIYAAGTLKDGTLQGDLVVVGDGDPLLNLQNIWRVADMVRRAGIEQVSGRIVIDATAFDDQDYVPGAEGFSENRAYTAPNGALSVNWNTVAFVVRPGEVGKPPQVVLDPPTTFVSFTNRAKTVEATSKRTLAVTEVKPGEFVVEGNLPVNRSEKAYYRAIHDPDAYAGHLFKEYLAQVGVTVDGKVVSGELPAKATEIAYWESPPLSYVVQLLNKHSSNFIAEQLTKTMGAHATGQPGTTEAGIEVIKRHIAEAGIPAESYTMLNGSGLNRNNRVSPKQLTTVLTAAWQDFTVRPEYVASLPIAAADGTIQWRMGGTAAADALRAKTGTLRGVSCLAGYAPARNGTVLGFAVLVNDVDGSLARAHALQDRIGATLASWSDPTTTAVPEPQKEKTETGAKN